MARSFRLPPTTFDLLDVFPSTPRLERLEIRQYSPRVGTTSSDILMHHLSEIKLVDVKLSTVAPLLGYLEIPNCKNLTYINEWSRLGEEDLPFDSLTGHQRLNDLIHSTIHHMPSQPEYEASLLLSPWFFRLVLGDRAKPSFYFQWHGLPQLEGIVDWLLDTLDCFPMPPSIQLGLGSRHDLWDPAIFSTLYRLPNVKQLDLSSTPHNGEGHGWLPLMACLESAIIDPGSQSSFWVFPDMIELGMIQPGVHIARVPDVLRGRYGQSTSLGVEEGALPERLSVLRLPSGVLDDDAIAEIRAIVGPGVLQLRP